MKKRKLMALLLSLSVLFGTIGTVSAALAGNSSIWTYSAGNPTEDWFYKQLTSQGKKIYDVILAKFKAGTLNDGKTSFDLVEEGVITKAAVEDYLKGDRTLFDDFAAAKDAFDLEHPEAWFIDSSDLSFRVTQGQNGDLHAYVGIGKEDNYYVDGVNSTGDVQKKTSALDSAIQSIVNGAGSYSTDAKKVKYVHERITKSISYRYETDCAPENAGYIRTVYALVTHEGVCEGYARSFQYVLNELGIPCVLIHGAQTSGVPEMHMWTAVRLEGKWYVVDPTWDDPVVLDTNGNIKTGQDGLDGGERENYLLVGQDVIGANWKPSGYVSTGTMEFMYPEIALISYGRSVQKVDGLEITSMDSEMEGYKSTVYHVSFNGKGLVESAKDRYYFLVKMYDVNADGSMDVFDDWYYPAHGLPAQKNPYFYDTDEYLVYDVSNCEYVEFAVTTKAPPDWQSNEDYLKPEMNGYYKGDYSDIIAESGLIRNENGGYEQPPYIKNASPGFTTPVTAGKSYNIHIEFNDVLYHPDQTSVDNAVEGKVNDARTAMGQTVGLDYRGYAYSWGMNAGKEHTFSNRREPTNIRWTCGTHGTHSDTGVINSACRITALDYEFTSSKMWADDSIQHEFYLTGLVGVKSNKFPNTWSYVFHNNYPFSTCPLCSPYKWNLWGQPQALNNPDDLDLSKLSVYGVNGYEGSLESLRKQMNLDPYDMNGRLMLVVENLDQDRAAGEALSDAIATKANEPTKAIKASSLYEIDFARVCAKTIVSNEQSVRVCLGFPEGIDASMAGIVFKAYHFTRNDDGVVVSVEEIPISVTPYGLVVTCMRFSPFAIVALDASMVSDLEEDTSRSLIVTVEGHGSVKVDGKKVGSVVSFKNSSSTHTLTITADEDYAIDTVSFSGKKEITANAKEITLSYDDIAAAGDILSVTFAAASVKEAEEEAGETAVPAAIPTTGQEESGTPEGPGGEGGTPGTGNTPGSGSGDNTGDEKDTYRIRIASGIRHGEIYTSHTYAEPGTWVTITVYPDTDYIVDWVDVEQENGKYLSVSQSGRRYSFIMPASDVTVYADFSLDIDTYEVWVASGIQHGDVYTSHTFAEPGTRVTITVAPDSSYKLDWILAEREDNGKSLSLNRSGNRYTFTMPYSDVFIDVGFSLQMTYSSQTTTQPPTSTPASTPTATASFSDVQSGSYYYDAVIWTVENRIASGYSDGTFRPESTCSRADFVTYLWHAGGSRISSSRTNPFVDVDPSAYYYEAVLWALENGVTFGNGTNTFDPNGTCTRAQIITFLWRAHDRPAVVGGPAFSDVPSESYYANAVAWAAAKGIATGTTATTFEPDGICLRGQCVTFLYRVLTGG